MFASLPSLAWSDAECLFVWWLSERIHHVQCMAARAKKKALKKCKTGKSLTTSKVSCLQVSKDANSDNAATLCNFYRASA